MGRNPQETVNLVTFMHLLKKSSVENFIFCAVLFITLINDNVNL